MGILQEARNELKKLAFQGFKNYNPTIMKNIPLEWEHFGAVENDKIILIPTPEDVDVTSCQYYAPAGSIFPKHTHSTKESGIVLGEIIIYTHTGPTTYKTGDVFKIEPEVVHSIEFITDTLLILTWEPKFKENEWEAKKH